jgi:hypothetical protein
MADVPEGVARVGLAGWIGESGDLWESPTVLGTIGDQLYLVEIDGGNRERVLVELIDHYEVDNGGLRVDIVLFGDAGSVFASSLSFLGLWPKSSADVPADVFVDDHYKAAFTKAGEEIIVGVRHALRPKDGPPRRQFRFRPNQYEQAVSDLARESRRLRDDLIALAQQRAPQKVESLERSFQAPTPMGSSLRLQ